MAAANEIPREWLEEFEAAAQRSLFARLVATLLAMMSSGWHTGNPFRDYWKARNP